MSVKRTENSLEQRQQERQNRIRQGKEEKQRPESADKRLRGPNKPSI